MGTFRYKITLLPVNGGSPETVEVLVVTSVPAPVLERLGVKPHRTIQMRLADGRASQSPMGRLMAEIKGEREEILCVFGEPDDLPTIGAHTLEAFLLAVDPMKQDLIPSEALWAARGVDDDEAWRARINIDREVQNGYPVIQGT